MAHGDDNPGQQGKAGASSDPRAPDLSQTIPAGGDQILAGRYRILGRLGSGGMGEVWRAHDTTLDIDVAIKVVPAILARHESTLNALKREARIALKLTHPAICRIFDFHQDGETAFLVMELIEGKTLEQLLADRPDHRMTWEELRPIAEQLAEALQLAHSQDPPVLHRDIKPANIMITKSGQAKLVDFGIARTIRTQFTAVTGRQETSGTILYMSPEQFRGDKVDARSDIYSFCAVLYEALAGRPLVSAEGSIPWQILEKEFEPIEGVPGDVNARLREGLARLSSERCLDWLATSLTTHPEEARLNVEQQQDSKTEEVKLRDAANDNTATVVVGDLDQDWQPPPVVKADERPNSTFPPTRVLQDHINARIASNLFGSELCCTEAGKTLRDRFRRTAFRMSPRPVRAALIKLLCVLAFIPLFLIITFLFAPSDATFLDHTYNVCSGGYSLQIAENPTEAEYLALQNRHAESGRVRVLHRFVSDAPGPTSELPTFSRTRNGSHDRYSTGWNSIGRYPYEFILEIQAMSGTRYEFWRAEYVTLRWWVWRGLTPWLYGVVIIPLALRSVR